MKQDLSAIKPHVLFLPRWYPHRYDPMFGLFVARHAKAVATNAKISVLYSHPDEKQRTDFEIETFIEDGVFSLKVYFKKSKLKPALLAALVNLYRFLICHWKGFGQIRRERGTIDLVHVHVLTRMGVVALLYKILTGTPYVITEHWSRYHRSVGTYKGFLRKLFTKIVVRKAGAMMPVTENLKEAMLSWGLRNENYRIVPNVVDVNLFKPAEKTKSSPVKTLVHLSCFSDHFKNISGILRVMKQLSELRTDFHLKLIGDGEDFSKMVDYAAELGLAGKWVTFEGLKENQELVDLLANSDLMIMFSNAENLPVVILESFACGVPVLSTRVGGIHEHLNNERGCLSAPRDEIAFLEVLNKMLDNLEDYDRQKLRDYAVNQFSEEVIGKTLYEIYHQVLEKKGGKS